MKNTTRNIIGIAQSNLNDGIEKCVMRTKKAKYIHSVTIILVTAIIGFLFYVLNYYTPLYADDYVYCFSFATDERIESIGQIVDSQIAHYQSMNGRIITHSLAQLFLLIGDYIFNFTNTIFFLALLYLIYFHSCGTFKNFSISKFSLIAMLLFLVSPAFGQSFLWITGSANYLYGILIILCFLVPYRLQLHKNNCRLSVFLEIVLAIGYLLFGIVAGWTNENTSVAMIAMIIGYIVLYVVKSIKIHLWNITGCIGGIIGCILMLTASGTSKRLEYFGGSGGIGAWIKRFIFYSCDIFTNLNWAILFFIVLSALYIYQKRDIIKKLSFNQLVMILKDCGVPLVYLLGFFGSVYSMIVAPIFPERAWSGPCIIFLIATISLSSLVDMSDIIAKSGKRMVFAFVLALCISTYFNAFFELKNINSFFHNREAIIEASIELGERNIEIPSIGGETGYSCYPASGDLSSDSNEFPNKAIAKYYEIDEIICSD